MTHFGFLSHTDSIVEVTYMNMLVMFKSITIAMSGPVLINAIIINMISIETAAWMIMMANIDQ